ncbi:MAG: PhoPQ-activated pathogenicity-related family protein [Verrucomicrobiales bacterium]|nr:PhoPQ-activated pathogenicity-related family protein [Verrucomicrobiales bacterium]
MNTTLFPVRTLIIGLSFFLAHTLLSAETAAKNGALKKYVNKPDNSYSYKLVKQARIGDCKVLIYTMTSQTWQGIKWEHWLSILIPDNVHPGDKGVLLIAGGADKKNNPPSAESTEARLFSLLASQSGAVIAILQNVPNQPLFANFYEDDIIAHSYVKFLDGGDDDWPLLLPMVKSAVRAMDTIEEISEKNHQHKIGKFIVTGASKRGWTTWLTAATDDRVCAIAPMVIDMLNTEAQMKQQLETYGKFSDKIEPYTKRNIQSRMKTPRGKELMSIVDPYSYRDQLTLPKLILLGSNDPFWTVDAANHYFDDLKGTKHLVYAPNTGHSLMGALPIAPTLLNFIKATLDDKTLPTLNWNWASNGKLTVDWKIEGAKAQLWHAHSDTRDFRESRWTATPLVVEDAHCEAEVIASGKGWDAWFVQVDFPDKGSMWDAYSLSTQIKVLPKHFPFPLKTNEKIR